MIQLIFLVFPLDVLRGYRGGGEGRLLAPKYRRLVEGLGDHQLWELPRRQVLEHLDLVVTRPWPRTVQATLAVILRVILKSVLLIENSEFYLFMTCTFSLSSMHAHVREWHLAHVSSLLTHYGVKAPEISYGALWLHFRCVVRVQIVVPNSRANFQVLQGLIFVESRFCVAVRAQNRFQLHGLKLRILLLLETILRAALYMRVRNGHWSQQVGNIIISWACIRLVHQTLRG